MDWGSKVTYLAQTAFNKGVVPFGVKDNDRLEHVAVMGRVGAGRATILATMALQDIERGMSVIVLDAAGNLTPMLLESLSEAARERLVYLDPSDGEHPFSWNPIDEFRPLGERALPVLSQALASMYRIVPGVLTEMVAAFSLAHTEATTLLLYNVVTDAKIRSSVFGTDTPEALRFEAALKSEAETVDSINEHGRYVAKDTLVRNLLGQVESKFSLAQGSEGALVVVDLSRIRMFPTRITPLVRMFTQAARAHGLMGEHVALYLSDSAKYLSEANVLSILPERRVAVTIAATVPGEEDKAVSESAIRQCGSVISFASHPADAPLVDKIFYPYVSSDELAKLKERELCALLTIDAVRTRPFFATALPPPKRAGVSYQDLQVTSRNKYTISRLKADQLFRKPPSEEEGKGKGKDGEPGSFSNAFRSIFTKKADGAAAPAQPGAPAPGAKKETGDKPAGQAPGQPASPKKVEAKDAAAEKKETAPVKPAEISEADLRQMLYVDPVGRFGLPA